MEHVIVWLTLLYMVSLSNVINVVADPEGFLSLACGASTAFVDNLNISWIPDKTYISTGSVSVLANGNQSVRYFPQPKSILRDLNCYQLGLQGGVYLIRATFTYHNYDSKQLPPHFNIVLNQTIIATVNLSSQDPWVEELIWSANNPASTYFCLLAIPNGGAPVISSLEVRPLPRSSYQSGFNGSRLLQKLSRINCGEAFQTVRYPTDPYDRIWDIDHNYSPVLSSTSLSFGGYITETGVAEAPPLAVLQSARLALNLNYITYLTSLAETGSYLVIAYFVELQNRTAQTVMNILVNSTLQSSNYIIPENFTAIERNFIVEASSLLNFTLQGVDSPPLINALEIYRIVDLLSHTYGTQVNSLNEIRVSYGIQQDWEYDPCLPVPWKGIKCSSGNPPSITSLDLSDSNLVGTLLPVFGDLADLTTLNLQMNRLSGSIPYALDDLSVLQVMNLSSNTLDGLIPAFTSLQSLKILDLENNILFGSIPASLGGLSELQTLNLQNNNFSGPVPSSLERDGLNLEISGNLCIQFPSCTSPVSPQLAPTNILGSSVSHKSHAGIIAGIAIACVMVLIGVGGFALFLFKRKHMGETTKSFSYGVRSVSSNVDIKNWTRAKQFTWHELVVASKKFKHEIGKGSFGPVYFGSLASGQQVAIKMGSNSSDFNMTSFENEVILLSQVHHQNLVSLLGYCEKSKKQLLVYEFMANGALLDHLYGSRAKHQRLDWKTRLQIVVGAATGLEYLHNGSDPKIIHRDVKSSNILLDSVMNAKVADFGLSKRVAELDISHVTTLVKGTAGYLDPEYYASGQLTDKSDVYSFGVVLMETICGREPFSNDVTPDQYNLVLWATPYLKNGAYHMVVDKFILGKYKELSMKIVADITCHSVERDPLQRPSMMQVLRALQNALATEIERCSEIEISSDFQLHQNA